MFRYGDESPPSGIYWTKWTGADWQTNINLAPSDWRIPIYLAGNYAGSRDFLRYIFDVAVLSDGKIILVWIKDDPSYTSLISRMYQRVYNGEWRSPVLLDESYVRGVDLSSDTAGTIHLAYWLRQPGSDKEGRGDLYHKTYDGSTWSVPELIDASWAACCSRMVAGAGDATFLVWERKTGDQVVPVWSKYANGVWDTAQMLGVRLGADAWYPTVDVLPDGAAVSILSSRCSDHVAIESKTLVQPTIEVSVDIKPGSYPNSINLKSKGKVPVAILTTADFDAFDVDPVTCVFAGANPLRWKIEDVDNDGDHDMLFHFKTRELELTKKSTEATLEGETYDGVQITGMDSVNIVPKGKGYGKKRK